MGTRNIIISYGFNKDYDLSTDDTASTDNVYIGYYVGKSIQNDASYNAVIGDNALSKATSANYNTAIGKNALNSVSLLNPMTSFIGAISVFLTVGFSSVLSKTYGSEEKRKTEKVFRASFILLVIFVVLIYVIQIPIAYIIIGNYAVDSEIKSMIWAYAMGVMISSGFGLINSLCCYLFIASGEGKIILKLSLLESIINLIGDIYNEKND